MDSVETSIGDLVDVTCCMLMTWPWHQRQRRKGTTGTEKPERGGRKRDNRRERKIDKQAVRKEREVRGGESEIEGERQREQRKRENE